MDVVATVPCVCVCDVDSFSPEVSSGLSGLGFWDGRTERSTLLLFIVFFPLLDPRP